MIIGFIALFFLTVYLLKLWLDWSYRRKHNAYKAKMASLLALNISHLHDAANFFSLIKNQTQEEDAGSFARGASFHFRSIFDELRKSSLMLDGDDREGIELLYSKEVIDLKDLLELELLQLGHANRIEVENKVSAEHVLTEGNFSLLSKMLLNLVENALKYTDKQVKIKLSDEGSKWQIRVSSFGKSIPEELAREINSSISVGTGHGLSSLQDVMQFHNAQVEIDTLAGEGSSIRLIFEKYSNKESIATAKKKPTKNLITKTMAVVSFLVLITVLIITINYNKGICLDYAKEIEAKYLDDELELKHERCLEALASMQESFSFDDTSQLLSLQDEFLDNFAKEDQELVSLILFREVLSKAPLAYKSVVDEQAKILVVEFPNSLELNLYMSDFYYGKQYYGPMLIHSSRAALSVLQAKLFMHPDLYTVEHSVPVELLAQLYAKPIEKFKQQELLLPETVEFAPEEAPEPSLKQLQESQEDLSPAELLQLDSLIEEQDKELGLELREF